MRSRIALLRLSEAKSFNFAYDQCGRADAADLDLIQKTEKR
jgi:hypothetical protein